jgi:hypothetical protein
MEKKTILNMDVNTSTYIDEMDQNKSPSSHFIVRPQEKQNRIVNINSIYERNNLIPYKVIV